MPTLKFPLTSICPPAPVLVVGLKKPILFTTPAGRTLPSAFFMEPLIQASVEETSKLTVFVSTEESNKNSTVCGSLLYDQSALALIGRTPTFHLPPKTQIGR